MQTTSHLLMIRPVAFGLNLQTLVSNSFQNKAALQTNVQDNALKEFDDLVLKLRYKGLNIIVIEDTLIPEKPDSIFPNNWITFHNDGSIFLFPMEAANRRTERRLDIIDHLKNEFSVNKIIDLSIYEKQNKYLEGTGSMVLDRDNQIAFACLSSRTNPEVLEVFCSNIGYKAITFNAVDEKLKPIYHTNVMMSMGKDFVVICLDAIPNLIERNFLIDTFKSTDKEIINLSFEQLNHYAGNMLLVANKNGKPYLVMSESAYLILTTEQKQQLERYAEIIYSDLKTIEENGGGSARCMLAEIHLPLL
jgi:hypothetical protein